MENGHSRKLGIDEPRQYQGLRNQEQSRSLTGGDDINPSYGSDTQANTDQEEHYCS